jgi:transcriptional regulator with XRE-family HTH domain
MLLGHKKSKYVAEPLERELRKRRIEYGIPQKQLAWDTGYNPQTLGDWETGKRVPSRRALKNWCQALNCELVLRDLP